MALLELFEAGSKAGIREIGVHAETGRDSGEGDCLFVCVCVHMCV